MVILTKVLKKEGTQDMEAFIHKEFELDTRSEIMEYRLQGLDARKVIVHFEERQAEMLIVERGDSMYVVTVSDPDRNFREQVLRSFHFTDLPD